MTKLLQRYLGSGDALARLHDHAARLRRLQGALESCLPAHLAPACRVANLKDGVLVVYARGGAIATKLKQLAPSVAGALAHAGHPVTALQVKVSIGEQGSYRKPPANRLISADARRQLEDFAATLPADAPLRAALERLARRSRPE